jgi:hypothetical protein
MNYFVPKLILSVFLIPMFDFDFYFMKGSATCYWGLCGFVASLPFIFIACNLMNWQFFYFLSRREFTTFMLSMNLGSRFPSGNGPVFNTKEAFFAFTLLILRMSVSTGLYTCLE